MISRILKNKAYLMHVNWFKYRFIGIKGYVDRARHRQLDLEGCIKSNSGWLYRSGIRPFFISQIIENRKSRKEGLLRHYETLKDEVLSYWKKERSELRTSLGNGSSYTESLIPLYIDIWSRLIEPIHFNQLRCHLKDEKYKEIDAIISDIEKSEPKHNQGVADLMMNLKPNIRKSIFDNCKIDSLREFDKNNPNYVPHFILDEIINYYKDWLMGKATTLTVRGSQVIRQGEYDVAVGMGNEESMRWLLEKLESLTVINDLKRARDEATRINELFNVKLKPKINDLILDIMEERLAGKCDSKYH